MRNYKHIKFQVDDEIARITLNRPEKHNALHPELLSEMTELCQTLSKLSDVRVVLLDAEGANFCAGADLEWMRGQINNSFDDNKQDAITLGTFFHTLSTIPQPLIGVVQGKVFGGGLGLVACCDIVIATDESQYCFSEVKLGLIPATITPYIIRKIGYSFSRSLFVSAERFTAETAHRIGLIHQVTSASNLADFSLKFAHRLKQNGRMAMAQAKQLVDQFYPIEPQMIDFTAEMLAHVRIGDEAQERMKLFFEK
jgi:methylglutaconyl-CoA hydratase